MVQRCSSEPSASISPLKIEKQQANTSGSQLVHKDLEGQRKIKQDMLRLKSNPNDLRSTGRPECRENSPLQESTSSKGTSAGGG